jgi:hypothetical protein
MVKVKRDQIKKYGIVLLPVRYNISSKQSLQAHHKKEPIVERVSMLTVVLGDRPDALGSILSGLAEHLPQQSFFVSMPDARLSN